MHRTRCPPCRGFTPALAESYSNIKDTAGKSFEIVFVSSDRDEASFQSYFSTMPWLALAFSDRQTKQKLSDQFGVQVSSSRHFDLHPCALHPPLFPSSSRSFF
jgi:hypothetical protein